MASIKTDALSKLESVEEPADIDLIPVGTGGGNVLKKLTVANMITWLKEKIGIADSLTASRVLVSDVSGKITASSVAAENIMNKANVKTMSATVASVNVASGNWSSNAETALTLPAGIYIIQGRVTFPSNTTGKRQIAIQNYTSGVILAANTVGAVSGGMDMNIMTILQTNAQIAVRLAYYHNAGSALTLTNGMIRALRIC